MQASYKQWKGGKMFNMCVQPRVVRLPIVNLCWLGVWHKRQPFQQYINKKSGRELKKVYAPTDSLKSKVHYHTSLLSVDIHFVQGLCKYLVYCPSHFLQYSMSAIITTNFHGTIYNDTGEYKGEGAPWTVIGHLIDWSIWQRDICYPLIMIID